jgi:hypothetical protein
VDNKLAIELAKNPVHHERCKYIDVRYHSIREHIKKNEVRVTHVPSNDQVADIFTKHFQGLYSRIAEGRSE